MPFCPPGYGFRLHETHSHNCRAWSDPNDMPNEQVYHRIGQRSVPQTIHHPVLLRPDLDRFSLQTEQHVSLQSRGLAAGRSSRCADVPQRHASVLSHLYRVLVHGTLAVVMVRAKHGAPHASPPGEGSLRLVCCCEIGHFGDHRGPQKGSHGD
jgi:hypothetical protein